VAVDDLSGLSGRVSRLPGTAVIALSVAEVREVLDRMAALEAENRELHTVVGMYVAHRHVGCATGGKCDCGLSATLADLGGTP
jgi:hypothetical protein